MLRDGTDIGRLVEADRADATADFLGDIGADPADLFRHFVLRNLCAAAGGFFEFAAGSPAAATEDDERVHVHWGVGFVWRPAGMVGAINAAYLRRSAIKSPFRGLIISLSKQVAAPPRPTAASMLHRFHKFEIDENARELRAGARVLLLQPRVFDLLVYLARNRERVVPKEELLEKLWPDVMVTDGSLQRAVSLARAALSEAGAENAIRTYSRQGYRMCADQGPPVGLGPWPQAQVEQNGAPAEDLEATIAALQQRDQLEGLSGDDLQRWAYAAHCAGRTPEAIRLLERTVAAYSARGDRRLAGWACTLLANLNLEWREVALAKGWWCRAQRLLGEEQTPELGYLHVVGARLAFVENDLDEAVREADLARDLGRAGGDANIESLGLTYGGEARISRGEVSQGIAAMDEAGVSVIASGLAAWAGGLVYCAVIHSCMARADWHRASQWTNQFTRWCEDHGHAAFPGLCRLHRAEVLCVRGELAQAEEEARVSLQALARCSRWAEGEAWHVLGDVLLAKGNYAEAREAFNTAYAQGWDPHPGLALLEYAEGHAALAERLLKHALEDKAWMNGARRGTLLAYYAIIASALGETEAARAALQEIEERPDLVSSSALRALVLRANGELAAAQQQPQKAISQLRSAIRAWEQIDARLPAAQVRCRLADVLAAEGEMESAMQELTTAAKLFQEAGAHGLVRQCQKLSRVAGAEFSDEKAGLLVPSEPVRSLNQ